MDAYIVDAVRSPIGRKNAALSALRGDDLAAQVLNGLTVRYDIGMQGTSAELIAEEWSLSREALDAYSLESHRRALAASDGGRFEREIVPIELPNAAGGPNPLSVESSQSGGAAVAARTVFLVDEAPRRETSAEALAALKPAFRPDGAVTAGNSSQVVGGSATVL